MVDPGLAHAWALRALAGLDCIPSLRHLELDLGVPRDRPFSAAEWDALGEILTRLSGPALVLGIGWRIGSIRKHVMPV